MSTFMARLNQLDSKQQLLLLGMAVVLSATLLYSLVNAPMKEKIDGLEQSSLALARDVAWMQEQLRQSPGKQPVAGKALEGSLLSSINRRFQTAGLSRAVKRVQPEGSNRMKVELDSADFALLIKELAWFETMGVSADSIQFQKAKEPGKVSGQFSLVRH